MTAKQRHLVIILKNVVYLTLGEAAVLGMQLIIFVVSFCVLVMFSVNFDVCSTAFVVYLLNGIPFEFLVK